MSGGAGTGARPPNKKPRRSGRGGVEKLGGTYFDSSLAAFLASFSAFLAALAAS
jgi:hypothetical protein